jgi:hypothetical protein
MLACRALRRPWVFAARGYATAWFAALPPETSVHGTAIGELFAVPD